MHVLDHEVELIFGNQQETLKKATAIILSEEVERRKKAKESMDKAEQLKFIKKWKTDNDIYINNNWSPNFVSDRHTFCYIEQQASSSTSPRCDSG